MLRSIALIVAGALALMAYAALAGRPLVYTDTRAFYALGEQVAVLAHLAPASDVATSLGEGTASAEASAARQRLAYTVAGSRSVYYATWLFLLQRVGGLWFLTFVQAAVAAAALLLFVRTVLGRTHDTSHYAATIGALALVSSLPVYLAFVMPDLFAGLGILAATLLILYWRRLTIAGRLAMAALLAVACVFHTTHMIVAGGLAIFALGASTIARAGVRDWRVGAAATGAIAAAAFVAGMLYPLGVRLVRHETIYSAPFLTARVVADGPGRDYLRRSCPAGGRWALCDFAGQQLDSSDDFLWKSDPGRGVFQLASYDQRVAIIREQPRFVLAVIAHDPAGVARAAAGNFLTMLTMWRTDEPLADPGPVLRDPKFAVFERIVPGGAACARGRADCAPQVGPEVMNVVVGAGLLASLSAIVGLFVSQAGLRRRFAGLATFWGVALVGNAAVCGIVSGPFMRYQSRLSWLVVLLAVTMLIAWRQARRPTSP